MYVTDDVGGVIENDCNIRLLNYGMMVLFKSIKIENSGGKTIENLDRGQSNLLIIKLQPSDDDE